MLRPGFEKITPDEIKPQEEKAAGTNHRISARVRFDYRGRPRPARFFFGGKSTGEAATELRQQQAGLWRNIAIQGITVHNIEMGEVYTVVDEDADEEVAFAPMELDVTADCLDVLIRLAVREEFRRIQIREPESMVIPRQDMERIFFQVHEQMKTQISLKARKYQD